MLKPMAMLVSLLIFWVPLSAVASSCGAGSSANDGAFKMLQRQLSALKAIERARGCQSGDRGGFFNACREVAIKIGEVQQQLGASTQGTCKMTRERADLRVKAARGPQRVAIRPVSPQQPDAAPKRRRGPKNALQFCVRLSDGYYFPTPNSQYGQKGGTDTALAQCRLICETQAMAVYVLNDRNDESADMVSAATGQSYAELPAAYDYHGGDAFRRCNWNGYVAKVRELAVLRQQSKTLAKLDIPLPDRRPAQDKAVFVPEAFSDYKPLPDRMVRSVGPSFIPDLAGDSLGLMPVSANETGF